MEKKRYIISKKLLWVSIMVQIGMTTTAENITTTEPPQENKAPEPVSAYAWSAWSSWSACSSSCGGGISVQHRQCLPRMKNESTETTTVVADTEPRVKRHTGLECQGDEKRYHECNTFPCPGGVLNTRASQCAAYDRRPFRGRFYTWVPYIDGDSPCTLNCRPLGQQFYASLSLVADGTPCTKRGSRAVCVQGDCKAVGGAVLSPVSTHELRCGRRLVSGVFTRPQLLFGYSHVATVPRGACRLNVSESFPTENYIGLKISNSSYIINGGFAVSTPGLYEAAGAQFRYTREDGLDSITAEGPIHHSIDIVILYTEPNLSIKYEYLTDSLPQEISTEPNNIGDFENPTTVARHARRRISTHKLGATESRKYIIRSQDRGSSEESFEENIVGPRKFVWKVTSYTQCTRTCGGGGIQLGKYHCVEIIPNMGDVEVSDVHCTGVVPPPRRRRCGSKPCPPRWRAAAWTSCPKCGPATRTRIVGCVQDYSNGITKISDHKCSAPKPLTIEKCNIPDCNIYGTGEVRQITSKRVGRPKEQIDAFRDSPVYSVAVNKSNTDIGPLYTHTAASRWLYSDWSECVGWCVGGGVQSRSIRCESPSGCSAKDSQENYRPCQPKVTCKTLEGQWFTGEWSPCSSNCHGKQVRGVLCIGGTGRHLKDSACKEPKPLQERECENECSPDWYYSDWGQCTGSCSDGSNIGSQRRTVVCAWGERKVMSDAECPPPTPHAVRPCDVQCATTPDSINDVDTSTDLQIISNGDTTTVSTTTTTQKHVKKHVPKEPQINPEFFTTTTTSTIRPQVKKHHGPKEPSNVLPIQPRLSPDCEDNLDNCALAVQARLCHYKYYVHNCCRSCWNR